MVLKATSYILFNLLWFACAYLGSVQKDLGVLIPIGIGLGFYFYLHTPKRAALRLVTVTALLGVSLDTAFYHLGLFKFPLAEDLLVIPLWLTGMWILFGTILCSSLGWLIGRPYLAAILGFVFGPLSYAAGSAFGILELRDPLWVSLLVLALTWAAVMPTLMILAARSRLLVRT